MDIAETCFKIFNLEILSNVWKPAHLWLAPGPMATRSRSTAAQGGRCFAAKQARACIDAKKNLRASSRKHCATSSFMLKEVTAPRCYCQAKVFHELDASSVDLLQSVFVMSLHPPRPNLRATGLPRPAACSTVVFFRSNPSLFSETRAPNHDCHTGIHDLDNGALKCVASREKEG